MVRTWRFLGFHPLASIQAYFASFRSVRHFDGLNFFACGTRVASAADGRSFGDSPALFKNWLGAAVGEHRGSKVSLCMIVHNEERQLADCLAPVASLFDEIVVVDTGSVDATRRIASQFTSHVFDFPWCDDFSAARNESFAVRAATGCFGSMRMTELATTTSSVCDHS